VRSAEKFSNLRSIKELLIKGVDRDIKMKEKKRAVDFTTELTNKSLAEEITKLLQQKTSRNTCCHFKQPLQKIVPSKSTPTLFLTLINGTFLLMFLFVYPYSRNYSWIPPMISLYLLANIFFAVAMTRDPGFIKADSSASFLKLVETFDPNVLCPSCEIVCTSDSRHCYICDRCVS